MGISSQFNSETKTASLQVEGQFDFSLHQAFRDAYRNLTTPGTSIRLDLSKTSYMDSSALGMILLLKEHADKHGGKLTLVSPSASVEKILTIANFHKLMTVEK